MTARVFGLLFVIALIGRPGQGEPELARYSFSEKHMGTEFTVTLYAADKQPAITAVRAAFKRVRDIENVLSDYKTSSEAMKVCTTNDAQPGQPIRVSDDFASVLKTALKVSERSGGAFDVTIGPLSRLWRETRTTKQLPDAATLSAAKAKVGLDKITFDAQQQTVTLAVTGMRLDFGGIGKGYAADEALAVLKAHGFPRALVAASGDIAVGDPPPGRDHWRVEIAPLGQGRPAPTVKLANAAVSTSGDLFQFVEIDGKRYSHILDPKTGLGQTGRRSATVIAQRCILSDSLATVASVLPPDQAIPIVESFDAAAYIVVKETEDVEETLVTSKRFAEYLTENHK
jgi:thiamine biosynthesis lipoprotein